MEESDLARASTDTVQGGIVEADDRQSDAHIPMNVHIVEALER